MSFFDREDVSKWVPGCACGVSLRIVAYVVSGGGRRYGLQCVTCARVNGGKPVSASVLTAAERADADARVFNLGQTHEGAAAEREEHSRATALARERERAEWWARYDAYLRTPKWQAKRAAVMDRDGRTCRACMEERAVQVHHTTYSHVFDEPMFDLVAVCIGCHERITAIDRRGIPREYREGA